MLRRIGPMVVVLLAAGCAADESEEYVNELSTALSTAHQKARCDQIKGTAALKGVHNALLVAGIAYHESGLAQCWAEATWTCQGPWSNDCGGPALAGAADGPCSYQQGGIGMFQLDAGTYSQTLAAYGSGVVDVAGNVLAGVDVIIHKVTVCPNTPSFGSTQEVVDFINSAKPGSANYETFMTAMAWCYNGCAPSYTSCNHYAVKNAYKSAVEQLRATFGDDYWYGGGAIAGGASTSRRVAQNGDGRLEVFVRGSDAAMWHQWQLEPSGGWGGWATLGGSFPGDPVVASNGDGRLEIFAIGHDGALHHRWQLGAGSWGGWVSLGGVGLEGEPAVGKNADGRLEVFVRSWDHALWHRWQLSPGGGWSGWASLGGILESEPAVGSNADGRLEVFHVGTDGAMYHSWQLQGGGWSGWASLGGAGLTGRPAVAANADGRLEIIARSWDGQLWQKWQTAVNAPWESSWYHFGEHATSDAQMAINSHGRLETFVRGGDGSLRHRWQLAPNGSWGGWVSRGGGLASF